MGFHLAKFGLLRHIRSRVMLRHEREDGEKDGQTDGQTDTAAHFIMLPSLRGRRHNKYEYSTTTDLRIGNFRSNRITNRIRV